MKVAVIPARGGSKRIPRKNIRLFMGKPMIGWSIEAAITSGAFDRVIVSTDDEEIAQVARSLGAEVPFMRPPELADDHANTVAVISHAIRSLIQVGPEIDLCCCIYATAPFVTPGAIRRGLEAMLDPTCDYAFSVTSFPYPIQRALRVKPDGRIEMFDHATANVRSQDLEEAFHDAGQFYWGRAAAWMERRAIFGSGSVPIILPRHEVQDIDTEEDWIRAEWLFRARQLSKASDAIS